MSRKSKKGFTLQNFLKKNLGGFTLIELLVVIAIIGLLVSIVLVWLSDARAQARDSQRKAETDSLRKALELHYADLNQYPEAIDWIKIEEDADNNGSFSQAMKKYLPTIPRDPLYPKVEEEKVFSYQYKSTEDKQGYKIHVEMETGQYANYEVYTGAGGEIVYGGVGVEEECYFPTPGWAKVADTIVRDITGIYTATVSKDIYCDDYNCILWTDEAAAPTTVCIATNFNVYGNILWSKTDSGKKAWGPETAISGGDIGGTHPSGLRVGNNGNLVGAPPDWLSDWLARDYTSAAGTFPAMGACKAKGSGWRLPTILELDSIRDQAKGSGPYSRLPGITSLAYLSSSETTATFIPLLAFWDGSSFGGNKSGSFWVRCVWRP